MTHGPAKRRDIARSVLPSTHRTGARQDLAGIKRRSRRALRQELRYLADADTTGDVVDRYDADPFDPRDYPDADIGVAVSRRRGGDKLGPLLRWGRAVTRDLPVEERLASVSRLFDDNLIGRHALSHLERDRHFYIDHPHNRWWRWLGANRATPPRPPLRTIAAAALEDGRHGELNRWMKAHPRKDGLVRTLAGSHDLDAFTDDCGRTPEWCAAVVRFRSG